MPKWRKDLAQGRCQDLPRETEARRLRNLRSLQTRVPGPKHFQRVKCIPPSNAFLAQLDDGRIQDGVEERGEDKWRERRATKGPPKPLAKNCGGDRGQSEGSRRQESPDASGERAEDAGRPEDVQAQAKNKASVDSEIQRGEEVLLHDPDHAGDGHAPVTLDIVAANERASAAADPPYKLAQLDIIDHT